MSVRSIFQWHWFDLKFQSQDYTVSGCSQRVNSSECNDAHSIISQISTRLTLLFLTIAAESKPNSPTLPSANAFVSNSSRTARRSPHSYPVTVAWTTLKRTMKSWSLDSVVKVMPSVTFLELDLRWAWMQYIVLHLRWWFYNLRANPMIIDDSTIEILNSNNLIWLNFLCRTLELTLQFVSHFRWSKSPTSRFWPCTKRRRNVQDLKHSSTILFCIESNFE